MGSKLQTSIIAIFKNHFKVSITVKVVDEYTASVLEIIKLD